MINAFMHYSDGTTVLQEIPNIERFKNRHLEDLFGGLVIGHDFRYRTNQAEYLVFVHFDEIQHRGPLVRR